MANTRVSTCKELTFADYLGNCKQFSLIILVFLLLKEQDIDKLDKQKQTHHRLVICYSIFKLNTGQYSTRKGLIIADYLWICEQFFLIIPAFFVLKDKNIDNLDKQKQTNLRLVIYVIPFLNLTMATTPLAKN